MLYRIAVCCVALFYLSRWFKVRGVIFIVGTVFGLLTGSLSGLLAGFVGGWLDETTMFLIDVLIALPFLVIALTVIAIFGSNLIVLMLLAGCSGWAGYTRLARGLVLSASQQQYVLAARSSGPTPLQLMVRHLLPNSWLKNRITMAVSFNTQPMPITTPMACKRAKPLSRCGALWASMPKPA